MSPPSDLASQTLADLRSRNIVSSRLAVEGNLLSIAGGGSLRIPTGGARGTWRRTVNNSLLPRSVSPESRRHLLYAILQDFIHHRLLLHGDAQTSHPLKDLDERLEPFDSVYRIPANSSTDRSVLFPVHVSVPIVFDTYRRRPTVSGPDSESQGYRRQTDKGFRGPFLEFFSSDHLGQLNGDLLEALKSLFAGTDGLTAVDRALVSALRTSIVAHCHARGIDRLKSIGNPGVGGEIWWQDAYKAVPKSTEYRPLEEFAAQGQRLCQDIMGIANAPGELGFSRMEKIHFVERTLAYHLSLYLVRLTNTLYSELDEVCDVLSSPAGISSPWKNREVVLRYHARSRIVSRVFGEAYKATLGQINEAYLLLPVINSVELAIRTVASREGDESIKMEGLAWTDAKQLVNDFQDRERELTLEVIAFLANLGRRYAGRSTQAERTLREEPIVALFDAVRDYYSVKERRRYPRDHHGGVFETVAGSGPQSFISTRPFRHFVLGDELVFLLVFTLFEGEDRERARLPLRELERRLKQDLLVPDDEAALADLRRTLARLGLLDRLSDVGEANFVRHPAGI